MSMQMGFGAPRFPGRRIVVTGGGSGIGQALVEILIAEGGRVAVLDRETSGVHAEAFAVRADLADEASLDAGLDEAIASLGGVDILVNNAGIGSTSTVVGCTTSEWESVFRVNVTAVFECIRKVVPIMLAQGGGVIVNTASVAGMIGLPGRAAYCSSKAAVVGLTRQVAVEYASQGIRCVSVCPGTVDSPWVGRLLAEAEDPDERRAQLIARQPLGRLARPDEVAKAIAYAASDDAAFMTGSELVIDGGIMAG